VEKKGKKREKEKGGEECLTSLGMHHTLLSAKDGRVFVCGSTVACRDLWHSVPTLLVLPRWPLVEHFLW
jgi:hypothetical protein